MHIDRSQNVTKSVIERRKFTKFVFIIQLNIIMNENTTDESSRALAEQHGALSISTNNHTRDNQFVITRCRRETNNVSSENQNNQETSEESDIEEKLLAVYWRAGKLGAAFFNVHTSELHILDEIVDRPPEYQMLTNLYRQVEPNVFIVDGKMQGNFIKHLKTMVFANDSPRAGVPHCKLNFISSKEYNFEACKRRIYSLSLPYEPKDCTIEERSIFLRTIVNFSQTQSVHALGALLRYLDLNWSKLNLDLQNKPSYVSLRKICLADIVNIDEETYKGLQIFSPVAHPASFKRGTQGSAKEGLSLFRIFNKCCSKVGQARLRVLLQHPSHDMSTLRGRQDVISYFLRPQSDTLIRNLCSSLRFIKNVNGILVKIKSLSAKPFQWKSLYNTLYNAVLICEMCENAREVDFLQQLASCDNEKLYEMALYMNRIVDFDLSKTEGKFTVKHGVDPELDKKKQTMSSLHGLMTETARQELRRLPEFVQECSMLYMPHLGYLLGVKEWAPNLTMMQKELPDMKFMNNDYIHYKSKGCEELDVIIGDTYPEIVAHETKIKMRLTTALTEHLHKLTDVIEQCAQLDCLIAISKVCKEHGFVRPQLTEDKIIDIRQGKHPLHMICSDNFVPNDTLSTQKDGYVKILTGPNSSGKSVYLKQVALIVYLAHIGSFVPAVAANIGVLTHIYTRIQSTECVAAHMSAFLIDLRQTALALQESSSDSLIIIDEFGKGTSEVDGLSLLAATTNAMLFRKQNCPHVFMSTHFLNIKDYIIKSPLLKFQSFEYITQDEEPVFLFKLTDGAATCSFAHIVARSTGIDIAVVDRAGTVLQAIMNNKLPPPNNKILNKLKTFTAIVKHDLLTD